MVIIASLLVCYLESMFSGRLDTQVIRFETTNPIRQIYHHGISITIQRLEGI